LLKILKPPLGWRKKVRLVPEAFFFMIGFKK
jgi:hypothetical protein